MTVVVVFVVDWVSEESFELGPHEVMTKPRQKKASIFIKEFCGKGNSEVCAVLSPAQISRKK